MDCGAGISEERPRISQIVTDEIRNFREILGY